MESSKSGSFEQ